MFMPEYFSTDSSHFPHILIPTKPLSPTQLAEVGMQHRRLHFTRNWTSQWCLFNPGSATEPASLLFIQPRK